MTTITGKILDASDRPLHVLVTFVPQSAPFIQGAGNVIGVPPVLLKSNANDGSFSVALQPGAYVVQYATSPVSQFAITVPASGGPYTIDSVAGLAAPAPYVPAANGSPEGAVVATVGMTYFDLTGGGFWVKKTGTGSTGWQQLLQL